MNPFQPVLPLNSAAGGYWAYRNIRVFYRGNLNGGGPALAPEFVRFVKTRFPGFRFENVLEWCGGPGFIGFSLLAEKICKRLVVADINPAAVRCVNKTVKENFLESKVGFYLSDNFDKIPKGEKFDLIVANPPSYFRLNARHPSFKDDGDHLRSEDRKWRIHRKFYSQVAEHLLPGGVLIIGEVEPYQSKVWIDGTGIPFDIRPRPPIKDFKKMIEKAGLQFVHSLPLANVHFSWLLVSQKRP